MQAIRNDVAIYAIHTNLDNVLRRGVYQKIAEKLGLQQLSILSPKPGTSDIGAGAIGQLSTAMSEGAFLAHVKSSLRTACIRHTRLLDRPVQRIAVCGGSGSFLLPEAIRQQADVFLTADFKYHEFFDAEDHLVITDVGHYESEQFTIELLLDIIREKYPTFALHSTGVNTNPVFYF